LSTTLDGRIVITWPAPHTPPTALPTWGVRIDDADTGEPILDAVALEMRLGDAGTGWSDKLIEVALTRLVTTDGNPIGHGPGAGNLIAYTEEYAAYREQRGLGQPHREGEFPSDDFNGPKLRTREFRYAVAEMRIADPA